jgi:nitrilase
LGNLLAGPLYHEAAILRAELDLLAIDRAALDLDVVGHYARPDLFQLRVNRQPQIAVGDWPIA